MTMTTTKEQKAKEGSAGERLKEIIEILGRYNLIHGLTPQKLRNILEDLGPTFVKLGQVLSMRQDMIPQEYCRELSFLRTEVRPMDFGEVISVLEREYGIGYTEVFSSVDETPLGSASIAQVHSAVLKNGSRVVIKVQRPGIYEQMDQDIRLLHKASVVIRIIGRTGNVIDFNAVLDEMWNAAKQEMDFLAEAENIRKFTELNAGLRYVAFPRVEWERTTARVLCMEQIDGISIDDTAALTEAGYDLKDIAEKLVAGYVKQVLEDGFFHADPHPGNIRIRGGKIVWLDLGMVGTISLHDRQLFKKAISALADNDVYDLKLALLGISRHSGKINHARLSEDIENMLSVYGTVELSGLDIGQAITDLIGIAEVNGLSMPPGVSMLSRGIITIEGVIRKIDPESNVIGIFSSVMARSVFEEFDFREVMERGLRTAYSINKRSSEFTSNLMDILKLISKGQSKLNIELTGSEEPLRTVNRMVNRLIVCILDAAVLLGSSLLCQTDMQPKLLGIPLLGAFGYIASLLLSIWLLFEFLRKKNR